MKTELLEKLNDILDSFAYNKEDKKETKKAIESVAQTLSDLAQEEFVASLPSLIGRQIRWLPITAVTKREAQIQQEEAQLGVEYHNFDANDLTEIAAFLVKHSTWHWGTRDMTLEEAEEIQEDHPIFQEIVELVIEIGVGVFNNEELDEYISFTELQSRLEYLAEHVESRLKVYVKPQEKNDMTIMTLQYNGKLGYLLHGLYDWLLQVVAGTIEVRKCAVNVCNNIFLVRKAGIEQKFCSAACRMKAHRNPDVLKPPEDDDIPF